MDQNNNITESTVLERYQNAIDYYWDASGSNKKSYKRSRFSIIILSALVTLMSSLVFCKFY